MSNEKTMLFNPDEVPAVNITPITNTVTPATINQGNTQTGAAYTAQKEQAINNHDEEFEDEFTLRRVDSTEATVWNQEKELDWIAKTLPQLSESDRIHIVKGLIKVGSQGALAWGQFDKGIITLSDIAAEGTAYHEAFHAVFNLLLDNNERMVLLNEYRGKHPNMGNLELEEELAEDFRAFVMQGGKDTRSLGRKIIDFFKSLFIKTKYWKDFRPSSIYYFRAINEGKYANKEEKIKSLDESRLRQEEYTPEMLDILKNSRDEQGNLLAPNKKPSNLTERQYIHVRTKAFKEWFGDWENNPEEASKVVDENGEPLVVYHGTNSQWTTYNPNLFGSATDEGYYGKGLYLSSVKNKAMQYGNIMELFVNMRNPFIVGIDNTLDMDESTRRGEIVNMFNRENAPDELKQYDGVLYSGTEGKFEEIVVPTANQVKSATNNVGTYSRTNDDTRYRKLPKGTLTTFDMMDDAIKENLLKKGWTKEKFDSISQEERDQAIKCIAF